MPFDTGKHITALYLKHQLSRKVYHSESDHHPSTMSYFTFVITVLLVVSASAQDDIDEEVEGRTFGHLAKPLKKLGHRLGQYLVYATSDYYPNQYRPPIVHHNNHYGGYYGYQPNGIVGFHAPGYGGGFRDI